MPVEILDSRPLQCVAPCLRIDLNNRISILGENVGQVIALPPLQHVPDPDQKFPSAQKQEPQRALPLGVWAAEGIEKKHEIFDLSESRSSRFSEIGKGSSTPEIA
ncbi:hypothetical protein [Polaromonas sp. UBA4122]|uniref:hypothetical protein n=1 Tax=Polaromonas sp. UBA4122 TaxID=1947074 RepID=UPI0025E655BE|nr:hypothetical protein [Polaromonas sp. UBA4122]